MAYLCLNGCFLVGQLKEMDLILEDGVVSLVRWIFKAASCELGSEILLCYITSLKPILQASSLPKTNNHQKYFLVL